MSSLPTVVSYSTEADDQSPLVVEPLVVMVNSSSSISNSYINSNDVVCLKSTVSSGPRALGGYSLSLLSNSNLAQPAVDDSPQASQLPGAKRLRPYSLPPSNPKRRITSSDILISASIPLADLLDNSQPPLVSCSSPPICGKAPQLLESMEVDQLHAPLSRHKSGGSEDSVSSPSAPCEFQTIIGGDECPPLPTAEPTNNGQEHLSSSTFAPSAPQIPFHYSPLVTTGPLSWHPADYDTMASSAAPRYFATGRAMSTTALLVDPRKRFRGRSLLSSRQPCSESDQGGGPPPPPSSLSKGPAWRGCDTSWWGFAFFVQ